jgi:DNA-binding MarR family transcriptional regulator
VELVDRSEQSGLLRRERSGPDRRRVTLSITAEGEALLRKLGSAAREELRVSGPLLVRSVLRLSRRPAARKNKARRKAIEKAGP